MDRDGETMSLFASEVLHDRIQAAGVGAGVVMTITKEVNPSTNRTSWKCESATAVVTDETPRVAPTDNRGASLEQVATLLWQCRAYAIRVAELTSDTGVDPTEIGLDARTMFIQATKMNQWPSAGEIDDFMSKASISGVDGDGASDLDESVESPQVTATPELAIAGGGPNDGDDLPF